MTLLRASRSPRSPAYNCAAAARPHYRAVRDAVRRCVRTSVGHLLWDHFFRALYGDPGRAHTSNAGPSWSFAERVAHQGRRSSDVQLLP